MAQTITSLLTESASATAAGDTQRSWQLINDYAQHFWLVDEQEIPQELLGDYYSVRAAAADWLGLDDEAVQALFSLESWAKQSNNHEAALIARSHLAYLSLNRSSHPVFPLPPADQLLADIAERMNQWRPHADSPTVKDDPNLTWQTADPRQASMLTAAATTAHNVATNLLSGDAPVPSGSNEMPADSAGSSEPREVQPALNSEQIAKLVEFFATMVRRFGKNSSTQADKLLWFSQEHWAAGRLEQAKQMAREVLELTTQPVAQFEAHFMLGHFAMLENLQAAMIPRQEHLNPEGMGQELLDLPDFGLADESATSVDTDQEVATHWSRCAEIALEIEAPALALERAELACRTLSALGREGDAWALASRMVEATRGIPMCPAILDMRAMLSQAAFMSGLHQEAWDHARAVAEWSEFTPNVERTIACYTIATFAGLELGLDTEVLQLQDRRAQLYRQAGQYVNASQVLQSLAMSGDLEYHEAIELMHEARELLRSVDGQGADEHSANDRSFDNPGSNQDAPSAEEMAAEDIAWNVAEWHLTMAHIVVEEDEVITHARKAAEQFGVANDPMKESMSWLTLAGGLLALGDTSEADSAITQATTALPDLKLWHQETDADFDPVISELVEHYQYILDFRKTE
ncbi:hypothetical protein [Corynebacterium suicordis]|uniref:Uncharacterized protein n=1 Tax=Corynebacterium suicordis DSM 45110 TaxID=1121369 RepID=A0ABR9ZK09_9CORY|nr:hypothetical protein [Corynebacterium suicordis]MBF4553768.1 hypothetical protein [Corynebacterium suicordis DSM 45110]MDR6277255.1 hypothetical protein [Corynebacterium suicordis]